jgi:hypothetical protein
MWMALCRRGILNYLLSVTFENDGASLLATASHTLLITAASQWTINSQTINAGQVMLQGDIYDFGVAGTGSSGVFEFLTENLSSEVDGILGWNLSGFSQVIATANTSISTGDTSWLAGNIDFTASNVVADNSVSAVPLPATLALMAFGVAGISIVRRRGSLGRATEKRT